MSLLVDRGRRRWAKGGCSIELTWATDNVSLKIYRDLGRSEGEKESNNSFDAWTSSDFTSRLSLPAHREVFWLLKQARRVRRPKYLCTLSSRQLKSTCIRLRSCVEAKKKVALPTVLSHQVGRFTRWATFPHQIGQFLKTLKSNNNATKEDAKIFLILKRLQKI